MGMLHDQTRRQLCLAAFFFAGVLPTLGVLGFGLVRHTSWWTQSEARRLAAAWGVKLGLRKVEHLRPGVVAYEGLDVADPETGARMFYCGRAEIAWGSSDEGSHPRLDVRVQQPEVTLEQITPLCRLVERLLTQARGLPEIDLHLTASEGVLRTAEGVLRLTEIQGRSDAQPEWTTAELQFQLADLGPERISIRVCRNRQVQPPAFGFELDTGGATVDCRRLAVGLPLFGALGDKARFAGNLRANETSDGWAGEITGGRFVDADLATLLAGCLPDVVGGPAEISLELARFRGRRLEEVRGAFRAGPGQIARPLLATAIERLGLTVGSIPAGTGPLSYREFSAAFVLDGQGLRIQGLCGNGKPEGNSRWPILVDRQAALLGEPIVQPQPAAALAHLLGSTQHLSVPATPGAHWLLTWLPLPEPVAVPAATPSSIQASRDVPTEPR